MASLMKWLRFNRKSKREEKQRNLRVCALETSSRNMIPELPERMVCSWKDCIKYFDNPDDFYSHMSVHQEGFPDGNNVPGGCKCEWIGCETLVKSRYKLREHLRSHTQEKVIACPTCGGLFSNFTRFTDHINRQQVVESGFQCSHCSKNFPNERLLRDHMRCHVNHYKCPLCDMTCPHPSAVRNHIKYRHSEERTFQCIQCEFAGKSQSDLRRHMDTHNENEYLCHITDCEFQCKTYGSLSKHFKETHQGLKEVPRHACHLCGKLFVRGERLTTHLKTIHKFKWPSGHRRFRYKENEDGFLRLQTIRYESIELTEEIMANRGKGKKPVKDDQQKTPLSGRVSRKIIPGPEEVQDGEATSPVKTEGMGEQAGDDSVCAITTVKVSRTPLIVQGNKPKTILGVQPTREHIDEALNRRKRKKEDGKGENDGVPKRSRKVSKNQPEQSHITGPVEVQSSNQSARRNQTANHGSSRIEKEKRNLKSAFDSVSENTCDSDDSEVSTKLIIDEPNSRITGSARRKLNAQKKTPVKFTKEDTCTISEVDTGARDKSPHEDAAHVHMRAHKRKSDSPQKRVHVSPEAGSSYIDMPMSLTSPPRNSNPAGKNVHDHGEQHAGVSGSQRRKLVSPIKKYIDMPLLTFTVEDGQSVNVMQAEPSGFPAQNMENVMQMESDGLTADNEPVSGIENVIHIYPQNDFADLGLQGPQVPQPVFTVNSSPTKYMGGATPGSTMSTLKAAALSTPGSTMSTLKAAALSSGILSDEEDIETTARELGINVQL